MVSLRQLRHSLLVRLIARVTILAQLAGFLPADARASIPAAPAATDSYTLPDLAPAALASAGDVLVYVVVVVADPSGLTKSAFGELLAHTGSDPQPYAFTGEPLDPNSGFQYHRARWYAPGVGHFTGMDPLGGNDSDPASLHRYLYANANPVSNTDPTGLFTLPSLATISAVLTTINTISLVTTAAVFGYRAGTIGNDLLIEEKIELEEALDEAKDLGGDLALSIAAYRFLNFEGLKFAGSLMRKLPSMAGRIKLFNVAQVNGRLAEHYMGNAYGLFRNAVRIGGRTPDFLTKTALREIKNVIELRWSGRVAAQLRDYAVFCKETGRQFYIHVRPGTKVDPRVEAELLQRFGPGSRGVLWDIIADIPESLRVIP